MTTFTIDIPDNTTEEVLTQLKRLGVKVRESKLDKLDELTSEDYQKHFEHRARVTKNNVLKYL
jgi:hypothetical protein